MVACLDPDCVPSSSGISQEAADGSALWADDPMDDSIALCGSRTDAVGQIIDLLVDEEEPASLPSAMNAVALISTLPEGFPMPEFGADSKGRIFVDWIDSRFRRVTLIVGEDDRISWAMLNGSDRATGVAGLSEDGLPGTLLAMIADIMRYGEPAFWPA